MSPRGVLRSVNEHAWPTAPVLRKLTNVRPDDLGAVVNVGPGKDTNREVVLPVVLFDEAVDGGTISYRFSFKIDGRARVDAAVFAGTREIFRRPTNWEEPGSPFTVAWSASGTAEGWYRLLLTGQFDDTTRLDKEVTFYHRPLLGGHREAAPMMAERPNVFISYSHKDEVWKDRVVAHLRVLEMEGALDVWDDRRIGAGHDWRPEIEQAIERAEIAILIVSKNFLTSKFIREQELTKILAGRTEGRLRVIPRLPSRARGTR